MPLINPNICHNCNIKDARDIDKCKKTNCRVINSWPVKELMRRAKDMQGEIDSLNDTLDRLVTSSVRLRQN